MMKFSLVNTVTALAIGLAVYVMLLVVMLFAIYLGLKTVVWSIAFVLLTMKACVLVFIIVWFFKFMYALAKSGDKYLDTTE